MSVDLQEVRDYIEQHVAEIAGVEDVAEALGISLERLRRDYRKKAGISLGRRVMCQRIQRAKQLLMDTDLRISEVCYAAGWPREDSGMRAFRREVGRTMREYREGVVGRNSRDRRR